MVASTTYAGSTIELVAALPATFDQAGYEALTYVGGECSLHEVPAVGREWVKVKETLVCSSMWSAVAYRMSSKTGDPAQAIYEALEADSTGIGSFKLSLDGAQTHYFTAQVAKFMLVDGGAQDVIHTRSVELLIQSDDIVTV